MSFAKLGLSEPLVNAVLEKGYSEPTPIQSKSIPAIIKKANIMACAQTGTGKTAGFTLPILEILNKGKSLPCGSPRALIIAPTRELAAQIDDSIIAYAKNMNINSTVIYGGVKANRQISRLGRGVDILVATPGRLLDLFRQGAVKLKHVEVLVLDEADRMLDMGFINDIKKVLAHLPKERQNLLFSATFTRQIRQFAKSLMSNPVEINVSPENKTAVKVTHKIHPVDKKRKSELLSHLIRENGWYQVLVFCRTKHGSNKLVKQLVADDIQSLAIHGNKSQLQRMTALSKFKEGKVQVLVATDVAARGIDIQQLPQVVNFELPDVPEDYVHRIGRTGRAGSSGSAISLVCADEIKQLLDIEKILNHPLKRELIDCFEPLHDLPTRAPAKSANAGVKTSNGRRGQANGRHNANRASKDNKPGSRAKRGSSAGTSRKRTPTKPANPNRNRKPENRTRRRKEES